MQAFVVVCPCFLFCYSWIQLSQFSSPLWSSSFRGHVQTIFGKINVIMTLRGGVACDANFFFVYIAFLLLLLLQYFAAIILIIQHGSFYCGVDPLPDAGVW